MTQEYTPSIETIIDVYASARANAMQIQLSDEWDREHKRIVKQAMGTLAAHDAQIRAEAPKITFGNAEAIAFTRAMFKELGHYAFFDLAFDDAQDAYENAFADEENGQYGFDAIEAGIKAVNQLRETTSEEQKQ